MKLYRVMSKEEWRNLIENGEEALKYDWKGRRVRYKWFATDLGYIASILARRMYRNFNISDKYKFVVEFEIEGTFIRKDELGFVNLGLDTERPYKLKCINWVANARCWFEREGKNLVRPFMYYWNKHGEMKKVIGSRELTNILKNGNLRKRPWFVRADKYWLVRRYENVD